MKMFRNILILLTTFASIVPTVLSAGVVISEFRTRGPNGAADEFVELYNNSDNPVDISGWKINASNSVGTTGTRVTVNAGTSIPARGHFLATNATPTTGYSGTVAGNQTYGTGIADDGGIALLMPDNTIVDQVGMSTGSAYKEGSVLTPQTTAVDQSYERKGGGGLGSTQDTNNNATDFQLRLSPQLPPQPQNLTNTPTPPFTVLQVSDCGDTGGANQLRQKIADANAMGGANIIFTCGPTVVIDSAKGSPVIGSNVFIDGANNMEISGNDLTIVFGVASTGTLVLQNVTVSHGHSSTFDGGGVSSNGIVSVSNSHFLFNSTSSGWSGSAIFTRAPLIITNSEFANNTGNGGAVKPGNSLSIATITGCSFHDNQSTAINSTSGYGGAMQILNGASVDIHTSSFTNNSADSAGGAIYVGASSTLHLDNTTFDGNAAPTGGGIHVDGTLNVQGSTFTNNSAGNWGGAIYNSANTNVTLDGTKFTGNTGPAGGAVRIDGTLQAINCAFSANKGSLGAALDTGNGGSSTVDTSTFTGNMPLTSVVSTVGGGVYNDGTTNLTNVTLTQNVANQGGGINSNGGSVTLNGVTLAGNSAVVNPGPGGDLGLGGGIANIGNTLTATNCTLSGNFADGQGGGILNQATSTLMNVTLSGNSTGAGGSGGSIATISPMNMTNTILVKGANGGNCSGTISGSFNLADDATCGFGAANSILLGPLANNGGFTQTHMPQPGSMAINSGTLSGAPLRDQRGFIRGSMPDVGAVEVGATLLPAPSSVVSTKNQGGTFYGVDLPLTGNGAVECRSGGSGGNHQVVLTFSSPVTLTGARVTQGAGAVSNYSVNASQVVINLTGVTNAQSIFATLFDVSDGTNVNDITVPIGFLMGDTTGDASVNSADISQTKSKSGQAVGPTNFRNDVTVDGSLNSADISLVKSKSGTALP